MTARLSALTLSFGLMLLAVACWLQPAGWMAVRAVDLLGAEGAVRAAQAGRPALLLQVLARELLVAAPWLVAGTVVAALLRALLARWQSASPAPQRVVDMAGVEYTLAGYGFSHAPAYGRLPLAPMPASVLPAGSGELERQAFAALAASASGVATYAAARAEHAATVSATGAGSPAAIVAVARHLSLLPSPSGEGRPLLTAQAAVARLPAFWRLAPAERDRVAAALALRAGAQRPWEIDDELAAADRCRPLQEPRRVEAASGVFLPAEADPVREALISVLHRLPDELPSWNINGSRQRHAPVDAWWLPDDAVLLLPATRLRRWLVPRLPGAAAATLALAVPSIDAHASDAALEKALRAVGLVAQANAWCRLRIGGSTRGRVASIVAAAWPPALTASWGAPPRGLCVEAI
jgi:hypothetical protein